VTYVGLALVGLRPAACYLLLHGTCRVCLRKGPECATQFLTHIDQSRRHESVWFTCLERVKTEPEPQNLRLARLLQLACTVCFYRTAPANLVASMHESTIPELSCSTCLVSLPTPLCLMGSWQQQQLCEPAPEHAWMPDSCDYPQLYKHLFISAIGTLPSLILCRILHRWVS
jgi:hypothetical protein